MEELKIYYEQDADLNLLKEGFCEEYHTDSNIDKKDIKEKLKNEDNTNDNKIDVLQGNKEKQKQKINAEIVTFQRCEKQGKKASNPRPTVLETVALPTELFPYMKFRNNIWWTVRDSNPGPTGYEPVALPTELTVHTSIAVTIW